MPILAARFGDSTVLAQENVGEEAIGAFDEFKRAAPEMSAGAATGSTSPKVTASGSFWQCSDGETTLTVDLWGNASYRRINGWVPKLPAVAKGAGSLASSVPDDTLIEKARQLATPWLSAEQLRAPEPAVKRETVLLAQVPAGAIREMPGRTIVRVGTYKINDGFLQAVFDPEGTLLRLDVALSNDRIRKFCDRAILARMPPARKVAADEALTLGCFFDPGEYRFEISAFAVEGEPFLNLGQASNPFGRDDFDLKAAHRVSVERYRDSQDYHWWCWTWWNRYGSVGAFRGNWQEKDGQGEWEYARHEVRRHRSLSSYKTVQGPPRQKKVIQQSDGPVEYPHAIGQTLEPAFYRDLEQCNVAFLFTHGGPIQGAYQVRRELDVWVIFAPPARKLGVGKLRHVFLDGCAAFTYRREPESAHLQKTWIQQAPVNGVRTVCGVDGGASLLDRGGWRFFGYYNKGDSISDAWALALLDEFIENCPATAAYGSTTAEALKTLSEGRFADQKAQPKAVAISIWQGMTRH
jgi:hypothetical protein